MLFSLLSVSHSALHADNPSMQVDEIVAHARRRNAELGITGSLIFTELHFAQNLEGPSEVVEALMERIERDTRHRDVQVIYRQTIRRRRFAGWTLAYSGPSLYVRDRVALPLEKPALQRDSLAIIELMLQFTREAR